MTDSLAVILPVQRWLRGAGPIELGLFGELPLVAIGLLVWTSVGNPGFDFEIFRQAGQSSSAPRSSSAPPPA